MREDENNLQGKKMPEDGGYYIVDGWTVLKDRNQLKKNGKTVKLQLKFMQVLLLLIRENGKTVSKDSLHQEVWAGVTITDHSINQAISRLRKVFGDNAQNPRIIETIPKVGYRLICPVEVVGKNKPPAAAPPTEPGKPAAPESRETNQNASGLVPWVFLVGIIALLILVTLSWISGFPELENAANDPTGMVPVTTALGFERDVTFSADDSLIAFAHSEPQSTQYDIFLQDGSQNARNLTNSTASERYPAFLPNGQKLVYTVTSEDSLAIHMMDTEDGSVTELFGRPRMQEINDRIKGLDLSHDGLMMVFSIKEGAGFPNSLYVMSLTTGNIRKLTDPAEDVAWDRFPVFSPGGEEIAFARMLISGEEDIFVCDLNGEKLRRMTSENGEIAGLDWPGNKHQEILYCRNQFGVHHLKGLTQNGSRRSLLPPFPVNPGGINPKLSSGGDYLAFEKWVLCANIYKMDLEAPASASTPPRRIVASSYSDWNARVSPDGKLIAFLSNRSGEDRLWISNADGTFGRPLPEQKVLHNAIPVWSPDSRSVLFAAHQKNAVNIYRCDVNRPETSLFIPNAQAPNFSADGSRVFFASTRQGDWQIWQFVFASGDTSQVTPNTGFFAQQTPSGDSLFFTKMVQPGIWRLSKNGGEHLTITDASTQEIQNWAVGRDGIYYIKLGIQKLPQLVFYRFADNSETEIALPQMAFPHLMNGLCLSNDGKSLLFSLLEHAEVDIVKVPFNNLLP